MIANIEIFLENTNPLRKNVGNDISVNTKVCLPLVKGGRGMFHKTCDAMRTEHPPSPLHKGEVTQNVSLKNQKKTPDNRRIIIFV